jgi:hypothetical protein
MAATCAACLRPIIKGGHPFVLSGTEVFHRACAQSIERSIATKQKLEIQRLKSAELESRREAANARIETQVAQNNARESEQNTQRAMDQLAVERELRRAAEAQRRAADRATERAAQARREVEDDLTSVRGQLTAARNEILRLQNEAIRNATDQLPVPPVADSRDATEIRFSLLELDPKDSP